MDIKVETQIKLNKFVPRGYQLPVLDAIENKGYKKVVAIMPRRAGKDLTAWHLCIRQCIKRPCVVYYIFPTYSQAKKVIWDSVTSSGMRILDYIPDEIVESKNSQEMKIRFVNGSLLQLVGSDNFDCFDDETEILTEDGWKLFKDLTQTEKVATLKDGYLQYELPLKYVDYDFDGELYAVSNSGTDFRVTPNHRFFVMSGKGFYKFKTISDPTIRHDLIPSQCGWIGEESINFLGYETGLFMAFLGIFLSEGSTFRDHKTYRVTISQIKKNGRDKIRKLLLDMGFNAHETKDGFNIEDKSLYLYCSQFGTQENRYIPKDVKALDKKYLKILFDWLVLGDGHKCKTYTAYYSISKKLVDDVQEIIIKLGLSGNVHIKQQKDHLLKGRMIYSKNTLYEVRVRTSKFKRFNGANNKNYIHKVSYKGKVYCVSTSSGIIKVRRNGKEMWSGNSLVGTNPQGIVFSEYALQDPRAYQFLRPILTANDGWALFISTPRGHNHLWELYNIALNSEEWFAYKLTVLDTGHISLNDIERERADGLMSEDLIQQEYFCDFSLGVEGAYYSKYIDKMRIKGQIGQVPWEVGFKVHTAWDLGVRDSTVIIFFQVIGQTVRVIDYYENSKQGLEFYVKILEEKPYSYGRHFAPHDIKVREFTSGMSRIEKAKQLGVTFNVAPDLSIMDGIEAVRSSFSKIWIDEIKCKDLIKALENYRQEFDSRKKTYKNCPLHDHHSHAADGFRYMCLSLPKTRDGASPEDLDRRYNEAYYGTNRGSGFFSDEPTHY